MKKKSTRIYVTGPRNGDYGFASGTLTLAQARRFVGGPIEPLYDAPWKDRDEDELSRDGRLRSLYMDGDTVRLGGAR